MCEHDVAWVRTVPDHPTLSGPLGGPLLAIWEAIEAGTVGALLASGCIAGLPVQDADTLDAPTPGIERLVADTETETFRELTARFECRVCPAEGVAQRSDSGAATGYGWACAWHTVQTSPSAEAGWVTVTDDLFVVTTLDTADGRPLLYHLADADARAQFARREMSPCPPHNVQITALPRKDA